MAFKIEKQNWDLRITYSPQGWIEYFIEFFSENEENKSIPVKNVFHLKRGDVFSPDSSLIDEYKEFANSKDLTSEIKKPKFPKEIVFILWKKEDDYFRIRSDMLGTTNDVLIHADCEIREKYFFLDKNSFLIELEKLSNQPIIIWWDLINSIPEDIFVNIIDSFPTKTELMHYSNGRITNILSEYLEWVTDSRNKFEKYLEKRKKLKMNTASISWINKYEVEKYIFIKNILQEMLLKFEKYSEKQWEKQILEIILILFPKYIKAYNSVPVMDYYTDPAKPKKRQIDLALLDANFHLDIIEIKKPSYHDTVSEKPFSTRDNHIPMKNLSSAVMQIEKYIFHLSKWWRDWEKELLKKYWDKIQIINPKWILIMWRCNKLSKRQRVDFEIIKRQYSNIVDIITYDDLIRRIEHVIGKFRWY